MTKVISKKQRPPSYKVPNVAYIIYPSGLVAVSSGHDQVLLLIEYEKRGIFKVLVSLSILLTDVPVDRALFHPRVRSGQEAGIAPATGAQLATELLRMLFLIVVDALAGGRGGLVAVDRLLGHGQFGHSVLVRHVVVGVARKRGLGLEPADLVDAAKGEELARDHPGAAADLGGVGDGAVGPQLEGAGALGLVAFRDRLADAHADAQQVRLDAGRQHGLLLLLLACRFGDGRTRLRTEKGGDLALGRIRRGAGERTLDSSRVGHDEQVDGMMIGCEIRMAKNGYASS